MSSAILIFFDDNAKLDEGKGSLKNKFTFSGVEALAWQGMRRANSELFNRRAT